MRILDASALTAARAWGSWLLLDLGEHAARVHWTNEPYHWHENTGEELFVVLDGLVEMHYTDGDETRIELLSPGRIAVVAAGERHVARPRGEARILVIERKDSD